MTWEQLMIKLILALIPVLVTLLTGVTTIAVKKLNEKWDSQTLKEYTTLAQNIVLSVVADLQQTVVDQIKKDSADGKLTADEALDIKNMAIAMVKERMPNVAMKFMEKAKVDVEKLIASFVEQAVNANAVIAIEEVA